VYGNRLKYPSWFLVLRAGRESSGKEFKARLSRPVATVAFPELLVRCVCTVSGSILNLGVMVGSWSVAKSSHIGM
jgi:hypothetical protein